MQFCARRNRLKHVERFIEIYKLRNVASCWLYCTNILAMHGAMNVKIRRILRNLMLYVFRAPI